MHKHTKNPNFKLKKKQMKNIKTIFIFFLISILQKLISIPIHIILLSYYNIDISVFAQAREKFGHKNEDVQIFYANNKMIFFTVTACLGKAARNPDDAYRSLAPPVNLS